MRFEFYATLTMAALLAAENNAVSFQSEEQINELPQIWSSSGEKTELAQVIKNTKNDLAELDAESSENPSFEIKLAQTKTKTKSESESGSGSESGSEASNASNASNSSEAASGSESGSGMESQSGSGSETESESDSEFGTLQLAQKVQELKMINAMGVINAAQIQNMQQMAAMQAMGMGMPGAGGMGMPMAGGGMGGNGMNFAQINSEHQHDQFLAQLAVVLATMPEDEIDQLESLLAQLGSSQDPEQVFAQISAEAESPHAQLAHILSGLDENDLAQITSLLEDSNQELAQTESETESEIDSEAESVVSSDQEMAQTESESESESEDSNQEMAQMESESEVTDEMEEQPTVLVEVGNETNSQIGDETFDKVAEFLAQLDEPTVKKLDQIFTQLSSADQSLAQTASITDASLNDDLEVLAQYLAQLDEVELEELGNLVQTKAADFNVEEHGLDFSQIDALDGEDYLY